MFIVNVGVRFVHALGDTICYLTACDLLGLLGVFSRLFFDCHKV